MENGLLGDHNKRQSLLLNEDDFDYAIELKPDDEYRQTAESLPQIVDFDEIDFDGVYEELAMYSSTTNKNEDLSYSDRSKLIKQASNTSVNSNRRMSNFDARMLDIHASNTTTEAFLSNSPKKHWTDVDIEDGSNKSNQHSNDDSSISKDNQFKSNRWTISKNEFTFRINLLEKHRKWTEKAARRSSIGFHKNHPYSNDKETMDKFLVALTGGVHIRRHQTSKVPEVVRLYSVTGCRTIEWEKPKAKDLHAQRLQQGDGTAAVDALYSSKYDRSAFDCCIAGKNHIL